MEFSQNSPNSMDSLFFRKKWSKILGISLLAVIFMIGCLYLKYYYDAENAIITHEQIIIEEISVESLSVEDY